MCNYVLPWQSWLYLSHPPVGSNTPISHVPREADVWTSPQVFAHIPLNGCSGCVCMCTVGMCRHLCVLCVCGIYNICCACAFVCVKWLLAVCAACTRSTWSGLLSLLSLPPTHTHTPCMAVTLNSCVVLRCGVWIYLCFLLPLYCAMGVVTNTIRNEFLGFGVVCNSILGDGCVLPFSFIVFTGGCVHGAQQDPLENVGLLKKQWKNM